MPLALLTFLVGVTYVPGLPSNAVVGRWGVWAVGVSIILWTIRIRPGPSHWLGLGLLAWIVAGFSWAVSGWDHAGGLVQWALIAATFCIGAETQSLDGVWRAIALAAWVSAGVAVVQALGYEPVWSITNGLPVGLMLSKNMAAELAVLGVIGALALRSWPLLFGPALLLGLSQSKAAVLALIAAAFAAAWSSIPREERGYVALAAGLLTLLAAVVVGQLFQPRLTIWASILPAITLWGDGLGSVSIAFPGAEFAHNEFLHYAFELGVGSLLIWGIVIYALGAEGTAARAALVAILAFALVWFPLHGPTTAFMAALLAGWLCGVRRRAGVFESYRGARSSRGVSDADPLGIGALSAADFGRFDIPAGSQPPLGARELRHPL